MSTAWIAAFAVLSVAVLALGLIVLGVVRQSVAALGEATAAARSSVKAGQPKGLTAGTPVPDFAADTTGTVFGLSDLRGRRSIVLFLSSGCSPCYTLAAELRNNRPAIEPAQLVVVADASPQGQRLAEGLPARVVFEHGEVSRAFETASTPHAFAVDESGVVLGAFVPNTTRQLVELSDLVWEGGGADFEPVTRPAADDPILTR